MVCNGCDTLGFVVIFKHLCLFGSGEFMQGGLGGCNLIILIHNQHMCACMCMYICV